MDQGQRDRRRRGRGRHLRCRPAAAVTAARGYLSAAGYRQYAVVADGAEAIRVTVRITEPTRFLSLIGIDSFTCTGTAIASLVTGVTGSS